MSCPAGWRRIRRTGRGSASRVWRSRSAGLSILVDNGTRMSCPAMHTFHADMDLGYMDLN
jgi:hypothetical protein